jgi:hypothetical protein
MMFNIGIMMAVSSFWCYVAKACVPNNCHGSFQIDLILSAWPATRLWRPTMLETDFCSRSAFPPLGKPGRLLQETAA